MQTYLDCLQHILDKGEEKQDRTGTGVLSSFGYQMRFDISKSFPLLTTKKIHLKSAIYELLWFLKGETNIKYLQDHGVRIWNEWADEKGDLGPVYGKQWRFWENPQGGSIDQIKNLIDSIKNNPHSRRHIVIAYNPSDVPDMKLPPCHCFFQFYVSGDKLSCHLYQRSADAFLGVPFNIASYSLLTYMVAQVCDLKAYEFIHSFGDLHIYKNHMNQVKTQLQRKPYALPQLEINPKVKDIFGFSFEDFNLTNYTSHPHIAGEVSV